MNRTLFASVAALALTGVSALASQPPETQDKQKAQADARYEALQAQVRQQEEERRQAQQRYEQGVAEAAEAQRRYEAENARYQAELARSRAAQSDYERRMRERGGNSSAAAAGETGASASADTQTAANGLTCEEQLRRNRRRGRTAGAVVGGVAGGLIGNSSIGRLAAIATLAPVGALIGDAIASRLNCREQLQAAAATEEAVRGGVGTTTTWTSDTRENVTGSSTVVAADASTPNEAQCLTVTDIIIVDGEETRAPKRMCRRPPSNAFVRV